MNRAEGFFALSLSIIMIAIVVVLAVLGVHDYILMILGAVVVLAISKILTELGE